MDLQPGQTLIFVGDHTSPDEPGYVDIISGVLARFHPELRLNLISAGSKGQTAAALRSRALLDILTSSRPDWLAVGIGMADALREPIATKLVNDYQERATQRDDAAEVAFGPEYRTHIHDVEPVSDAGPRLELPLELLPEFKRNLAEALTELQQSGVRPILITLAVLGNDREHPINDLLRAYSKAIREVAQERGAPLVDVERAFRDIFDRAANYKQRLALTGPGGKLNAQGQTLIARTFLAAFRLLPNPGFHP